MNTSHEHDHDHAEHKHGAHRHRHDAAAFVRTVVTERAGIDFPA